jgi:hypothetical protein
MGSKFMEFLGVLKEKFIKNENFDPNYQENLVNSLLDEEDSDAKITPMETKIFKDTKRFLDLSKTYSVVVKKKDENDKENGIVFIFRERFRSSSEESFAEGLEKLRVDNKCLMALAIGFQSNQEKAKFEEQNDKKFGNIRAIHFSKIPENGFEEALNIAFPDTTEVNKAKITDENEGSQNLTDLRNEKSIIQVGNDSPDEKHTKMDEQIISSLRPRISANKFAFYLGAGASRPFDFPTWYQMIKETIETLSNEVRNQNTNSNFIGDLASSLQNSYSTVMFSTFVSHFCSKVTEYKKSGYDKSWNDEKSLKIGIDGVVKKYLSKVERFVGSLRDEKLAINIISSFCSKNRSIPIFTTNYDPVAELSILFRGGKPQTTWNYEQRKGEILESEICHLHGISMPIEDDFLMELFKDKEEELKKAQEWINEVRDEEKSKESVPVLLENSYDLIRERPYCFALYPLLQAFTDRSILIIGSSLTDVNLRLIAKKAFEITRKSQYAIMRIGPSLQEIATHNEIEKSDELKHMRDAPFTEIGLNPIWKTDVEITSFLNNLLLNPIKQ